MAKAKPPQGVNIATIRTAQTLIERHGDQALKFAESQAERLERTGSESSAVEWRDVIAAIRRIQEDKKRN